MRIKGVHVILHLLMTCFIQNTVSKRILVAYWGQNSSGNQHPGNPEQELTDVCQNREYDIIVIGFVVTFFSPNNKDGMPSVNFSLHCWTPVSPEYPDLYRCPNIEQGIIDCQHKGKKVLISLGGATGYNNLNDDDAKVLAKNLWDLFLGGTGQTNIRPFGSAILDGIDLDIEDHLSGGYAQLVKSLRQLENSAGSKKYLITGAPQCPYPDASLGPGSGTALGEEGKEFDHLFVQFYNNYCHTGDPDYFYPNLQDWLDYAAEVKSSSGKGPDILVGMPAGPGGSGDPKYYRTPDEVQDIYSNLEDKPDFGGFMLWDAAWDQQNVIDNRLYSDHIADIIGEDYPTKTPTTPGPTHKTSTEGPTSSKPSTPPPTPGDFCKGKEDGLYADPNDPAGYIQCVGGETYYMKCPPGLVWNDEIKACDWPTMKDQSHDQGPHPRHAGVKPDLKDRFPAKLVFNPIHKDRKSVNKKGLFHKHNE